LGITELNGFNGGGGDGNSAEQDCRSDAGNDSFDEKIEFH
jgi:hypothetical protein